MSLQLDMYVRAHTHTCIYTHTYINTHIHTLKTNLLYDLVIHLKVYIHSELSHFTKEIHTYLSVFISFVIVISGARTTVKVSEVSVHGYLTLLCFESVVAQNPMVKMHGKRGLFTYDRDDGKNGGGRAGP